MVVLSFSGRGKFGAGAELDGAKSCDVRHLCGIGPSVWRGRSVSQAIGLASRL